MKELIERFEKEIGDMNGDCPHIAEASAPDCANLCKRIAIEFIMKTLMDATVSVARAGRISEREGVGDIKEEKVEFYKPKEYTLLVGQLIAKGDEMFDNFIKEYYSPKEKE